MADSLQDLLDLLQESVVIDGRSQLDDTEMTWTFGLVFFASGATEVSIDSTEMRIVRTSLTRSSTLLIPVSSC